MKKIFTGVILIIVFLTYWAGPALAAGDEIKYIPYECDLFSVKFQRPEGWDVKVDAEHIGMTNPTNKNLQLIFLEDKHFEGTLDQYFEAYKKRINKESYKLFDKKPMEIAGYGAYYIKIKTKKKDLGHIIFIRNNLPIILVLKTKKGHYRNSEKILMKMAETMKFYSPRAK